MPETCTAEQADFRNAWQQNGTAMVAAFLSPHELGELRSAVDARYELLRQHAADDPHIDADAAGIINATDYCINTWLPLDPVGDVLPSLELIPGSNKTMRNVPSMEGKEKSRSDDWVKSNIAGESWVPHAEPGDAILFDHWTLHRTQRMEQENAVRTSCEFRFVRTS